MDATTQELGPYRLDVLLGRGGMGEVYRAWDARLERWVAIKRLRTEGAAPPARARFLREARAAAGLGHPGILQVFDFLDRDGTDWIVMEMVDGPDLATLLQDGPLDVGLVLDYGRQIADALAAAHAKGIVHRDLKTENVMVSSSGHTKVLDFGLAKTLSLELCHDGDGEPTPTSDPAALSLEGCIAGTPRAMSPEQALGHDIDFRSDLFALGVLLYELLSARPPFRGRTAKETLSRVISHQQQPLQRLNPQIPKTLIEIVDGLLEKDPAFRPKGAVAVAESLAKISAGIPSRLEHSLVGVTTFGAMPATDPSPGEVVVVKTLLCSDLVGSTSLLAEIGDRAASDLFRRHDRLARDLLAEHDGTEIDRTDGFLMLFDRPWNAVRYALSYHQALADLTLVSRVGIHLGEVILRRNSQADIVRGAKPVEAEGLAKPTVARLMSLAEGGQTLLTRGAYDVARRGATGEGGVAPHSPQGDIRDLRWLEHGPYHFKGVADKVDVFEVGFAAVAPLRPPGSSEKAHHAESGAPLPRQVTESVPADRGGPVPEVGGLLTLAVGAVASKLLQAAAERQVRHFFGEAMAEVRELGQEAPLDAAMFRIWVACAELILDRIRVLCDFVPDESVDNRGLADFGNALTRFIDQRAVGGELLQGLIEPCDGGPDAAVLRDAWSRIEGPELPAGFRWPAVADALRKRLAKKRILPPELHDQLDIQGLATIRAATAKFQPQSDEALYAREMRQKYRALDLSAMRPSGAGDTWQILLRDAFVPQLAREDPPPVELPKAMERRLMEETGEVERSAWQLERARESYAARTPEPVLQVITDAANRRLVLLGTPGAGKSTLTRFLLLSTVDPPRDAKTGKPPAWAAALEGHLPLLVELHDFAIAWAEKRCDSFLTYWHDLGGSQGYHLDRVWLDRRLRGGPSLVLLDGIDEIFDREWREKVLHGIAVFARTYPKARVVVTSRPVGYPETILRAAEFRHFALEDFDQRQIDGFLAGWFRQVFPDQPRRAEQRQTRIHDAAARSPAIRLLAGNPMLLTIMAMIAHLRELPRERWGIYSHAAKILCHHWDVNRHLTNAGFDGYVSLEDKEELLRRIACRMGAGEGGLVGNMMTQEALRTEVETYLSDRYGANGAEGKRLSDRLIAKLRAHTYVLCPRGLGQYGFMHRTIFEYFRASELVTRLREQPSYTIQTLRDQVFAVHWRDPEWRPVLRLVSGLVGDQNLALLVSYLIDSAYPEWRSKMNQQPPANLAVALQCMAEAGKPQALEQEALALVRALVEVVEYPRKWQGSEIASLLKDELLPTAGEYRLPEEARQWLEDCFEEVLGRIQSKSLVGPFARLAATWLSDSPSILRALRENAVTGKNYAIRSAALGALAQGWPDDEETRSLISQRALVDKHYDVQIAALEALARVWPEHVETRSLLGQRAVQDVHYNVRKAAVRILGQGWRGDGQACGILRRIAVADESMSVRGAALEALAQGYRHDGETHAFLCQRALEEENHEVRETVLRLLGGAWPEDEGETRSFLCRRALEDEHQTVRQAALEALVRTSLDPRSLLLLSCDLDGQAPFLDPREPVAPTHLRKGSKLLDIDEDDARALLTSSANELGWNPLHGAGSPD